MKVEVIEKTIAYGKNRYKVSFTGKWQVLMWGRWPDGNKRPAYRWIDISEDRVPESVKQEGGI